VLAKSISNGLRTKYFFEVAEVETLQYVKHPNTTGSILFPINSSCMAVSEITDLHYRRTTTWDRSIDRLIDFTLWEICRQCLDFTEASMVGCHWELGPKWKTVARIAAHRKHPPIQARSAIHRGIPSCRTNPGLFHVLFQNTYFKLISGHLQRFIYAQLLLQLFSNPYLHVAHLLTHLTNSRCCDHKNSIQFDQQRMNYVKARHFLPPTSEVFQFLCLLLCHGMNMFQGRPFQQ
jgi:hypothetical protein